ncbi:hypothetical protein KKA03_05380 [archaeon]|nr:hypothetical protein [archaeon]
MYNPFDKKIDEDLFIKTAFDILIDSEEAIIIEGDPNNPEFVDIGANIAGILWEVSEEGVEKIRKQIYEFLKRGIAGKKIALRLRAILNVIRQKQYPLKPLTSIEGVKELMKDSNVNYFDV